jgi:hypothetical protein
MFHASINEAVSCGRRFLGIQCSIFSWTGRESLEQAKEQFKKRYEEMKAAGERPFA